MPRRYKTTLPASTEFLLTRPDKELSEASRLSVRNFTKGTPNAVDISRHHDTMLPEQTSNLVHEPGAVCNHPLADRPSTHEGGKNGKIFQLGWVVGIVRLNLGGRLDVA